MILRRDDGADLAVVGKDALFIKRLYGVEVHDRGADTLGREKLRRLEGARDHQAGGEYRGVRTLAQNDGLAGNKGRCLIGDVVRAGTGQADIHGTLDIYRGFHGLIGLGCVAGGENCHARKLAHERDVLKRLVGADAEPGMGEGELHVRTGIGHGVADLLKRAARAEHGKCAGEGNIAREGKASGGADHVRLGDAEIIESVGEGLFKGAGLCRPCEVGVHDDDLAVFLAQQGKRLAVCFSS